MLKDVRHRLTAAIVHDIDAARHRTRKKTLHRRHDGALGIVGRDDSCNFRIFSHVWDHRIWVTFEKDEDRTS